MDAGDSILIVVEDQLSAVDRLTAAHVGLDGAEYGS